MIVKRKEMEGVTLHQALVKKSASSTHTQSCYNNKLQQFTDHNKIILENTFNLRLDIRFILRHAPVK